MGKKFLTVKDLATSLQLTERHIYRLIKEGTLPHYRIGGTIRFDAEQVREWLDSKRVYRKVQTHTIAGTILAIAK